MLRLLRRRIFFAMAVSACIAGCAGPTPQSGSSLLITGGTVVTMNGTNAVIENGAVAVSGDQIVAVGSASEIDAKYTHARRIDARGQIVLPGLINTHTHAPMVLYRGLADDMALMDWLT